MSHDEIAQVFDDLYRGWYSSIVRYAARRCGSVDLAEDCVHECFLRLCKELMRGARIDNPKGWLFRVIRNELSKPQWPGAPGGPAFSLDGLENLDGCPALAVEMDVEVGELTEMLWCLTVREEEVIILRLEGLTYAEIADTLGIGRESVKTLMARAVGRLRDLARTGAVSPGRRKKADVDIRNS